MFTHDKYIGFPLIGKSIVLQFYKEHQIPATTSGCFGLCLSVLALQFFYRYIAICKPEKLHIFNGKSIFYTSSPCFVLLFLCLIQAWFFMKPVPETQLHYQFVLRWKAKILKFFFRKIFRESFDMDSFDVAFVAMKYKVKHSVFFLEKKT